jgi:hypothetical protein
MHFKHIFADCLRTVPVQFSQKNQKSLRIKSYYHPPMCTLNFLLGTVLESHPEPDPE